MCGGGERGESIIEVQLRQAEISQHKFNSSSKPVRRGQFDEVSRVEAE